MAKATLVPSTPLAKRFHAIFHRRPGTAWSKKEVELYRGLVKGDAIVIEELMMVERMYRSCWPPDRNHNHLRHDLQRLLTYYGGEVDKARVWCGKHPLKSDRSKVIPMPPAQSEPWVPPSDPEEQAQLQRFLDEMARRGSAGCQRLKSEQDQQRLDFGAGI